MKKVIVIGASSGIGKRIAELYAEKKHRVLVTGRRKELLQTLQDEYPDQITVLDFDITKTQNIGQLQKAVELLGGLDILLISAGVGDVSKELDWAMDKWMIDTNVNGFAEIANWAFNFFERQGHGQLAAISSVAAYRGNHAAPAYSASKAFQSVYLEGLAIRAAKMKKDISVTCIEPGFVDTKLAKAEKPFWMVPVDKAARQIVRAIDRRKRRVFISRRWRLIAWILKWLPYDLYKKIG